MAQPVETSVVDGFQLIEVASVGDTMEHLHGQRAYMSHEMRPLSPGKFAGPAVTVLLKKEEPKEGAAILEGMLDALDSSPAGPST
jgi:regulator of RNase E activity RraA